MVADAGRKNTTYCRPLDALLEGGISRGSVLELCGPPGCAKEALAENIVRSFVEENQEVLFVGTHDQSRLADSLTHYVQICRI